MEMESFHGLSWMPQQNNSSALNSFSCSFNENDLRARKKKKKHRSPPLSTPPSQHQYSGMQLCLVWKCKSPFVAIIYGLRRLSRVFSPLVHYYTITVHGLLTPLSALAGFLKGYATSLPYQCGWGPANVLISHLVPFHSGRMSIAQFQKGKLQIIICWKTGPKAKLLHSYSLNLSRVQTVLIKRWNVSQFWAFVTERLS